MAKILKSEGFGADKVQALYHKTNEKMSKTLSLFKAGRSALIAFNPSMFD